MADTIKDVVMRIVLEAQKSRTVDSVKNDVEKTTEKVKDLKKEVKDLADVRKWADNQHKEIASDIERLQQRAADALKRSTDEVTKQGESLKDLVMELPGMTKLVEIFRMFAHYGQVAVKIVQKLWPILGRVALYGGGAAAAIGLFHDYLRPKNIDLFGRALSEASGILGTLGKVGWIVVKPLQLIYKAFSQLKDAIVGAYKWIKSWLFAFSDYKDSLEKGGELQLKLAKAQQARIEADEKAAIASKRLTEVTQVQNVAMREQLDIFLAQLKGGSSADARGLADRQRMGLMRAKSGELSSMWSNVGAESWREVDDLERAKQLASDLAGLAQSRLESHKAFAQEQMRSYQNQLKELETAKDLANAEKEREKSFAERLGRMSPAKLAQIERQAESIMQGDRTIGAARRLERLIGGRSALAADVYAERGREFAGSAGLQAAFGRDTEREEFAKKMEELTGIRAEEIKAAATQAEIQKKIAQRADEINKEMKSYLENTEKTLNALLKEIQAAQQQSGEIEVAMRSREVAVRKLF